MDVSLSNYSQSDIRKTLKNDFKSNKTTKNDNKSIQTIKNDTRSIKTLRNNNISRDSSLGNNKSEKPSWDNNTSTKTLKRTLEKRRPRLMFAKKQLKINEESIDSDENDEDLLELLKISEEKSLKRKKYRKYKEVYYAEEREVKRKRIAKLEAKRNKVVEEDDIIKKQCKNKDFYNEQYIKYKFKEKKLKKETNLETRAIFEIIMRESRRDLYDSNGDMKDEFKEARSTRFSSLKKEEKNPLVEAYYSNRKITNGSTKSVNVKDENEANKKFRSEIDIIESPRKKSAEMSSINEEINNSKKKTRIEESILIQDTIIVGNNKITDKSNINLENDIQNSGVSINQKDRKKSKNTRKTSSPLRKSNEKSRPISNFTKSKNKINSSNKKKVLHFSKTHTRSVETTKEGTTSKKQNYSLITISPEKTHIDIINNQQSEIFDSTVNIENSFTDSKNDTRQNKKQPERAYHKPLGNSQADPILHKNIVDISRTTIKEEKVNRPRLLSVNNQENQTNDIKFINNSSYKDNTKYGITKTTFRDTHSNQFQDKGLTRNPKFDDSFYELVKCDDNNNINSIIRKSKGFTPTGHPNRDLQNRSHDVYPKKMSSDGFEFRVSDINKIMNKKIDSSIMSSIPYKRDNLKDNIRIRTGVMNRPKVSHGIKPFNRSKECMPGRGILELNKKYQGLLEAEKLKALNFEPSSPQDFANSDHFANKNIEQIFSQNSYYKNNEYTQQLHNPNNCYNFKVVNESNANQVNIEALSKASNDINNSYVKFYPSKPKTPFDNIENGDRMFSKDHKRRGQQIEALSPYKDNSRKETLQHSPKQHVRAMNSNTVFYSTRTRDKSRKKFVSYSIESGHDDMKINGLRTSKVFYYNNQPEVPRLNQEDKSDKINNQIKYDDGQDMSLMNFEGYSRDNRHYYKPQNFKRERNNGSRDNSRNQNRMSNNYISDKKQAITHYPLDSQTEILKNHQRTDDLRLQVKIDITGLLKGTTKQKKANINKVFLEDAQKIKFS